MTWAVDQRTGSPARKAVLMNLADRADEAWSCFPGQRRIAEDTELGERTVRRALDDLETAGLIRRDHRRRKDGSWTSDRYVLAGIDTDPDAASLLADDSTSGQSGRRPKRPAAGAADGPAANAAGGEPSGVGNPQSPTPTGLGGACAPTHTPTREDADPATQLTLVTAPAKPAKPKRAQRATRIPKDWTPSPELRAATAAKAPWLDIDAEVVRFVRHFDGRGTRWIDWDKCWLNWVDRCQPPRGGGSSGGRPAPYRDTGWADGTSDADWDDWERERGGGRA